MNKAKYDGMSAAPEEGDRTTIATTTGPRKLSAAWTNYEAAGRDR